MKRFNPETELMENAYDHFMVKQNRFYFVNEISPIWAWKLFGINAMIQERIRIAIQHILGERTHGLPH